MRTLAHDAWLAGVRVQLSKHDQTQSAEAGRYWHAIRDKSYCFQKKELSLHALEELKDKHVLLKFWKQLTKEKRTKVSVQVRGDPDAILRSRCRVVIFASA